MKQNVPEIEILEYPTWGEYAEKLKEGWDVVGFSFFLYETPEALEMAHEARRQGIKELWAGGYGALTPQIESEFDRIFVGYSEDELAQVFGYRVTDIIHPPIFIPLSLGPIGLKYKIFGVLFTQRGCPLRCKFCQTPQYCPKPYKISLQSIERLLNYYRQIGVREVAIFDENFGTFKEHSEAVIDLFHKYGIYWHGIGLRAKTLLENYQSWAARSLVSCWVGIESLNQTTLDTINKRERVEQFEELVRKIHETNLFIGGYYMIGFEDDTEDSIREGVSRLADLHFDYLQFCVVTPLPRTPLWDEIDAKYGIFDYDWHHYDVKHLVWHHPYISPERMAELLDWSMRCGNPPRRYFKSISKLVRHYNKLAGSALRGWFYTLVQSPVHAWGLDAKDRH